jgi:hypothetical protein
VNVQTKPTPSFPGVLHTDIDFEKAMASKFVKQTHLHCVSTCEKTFNKFFKTGRLLFAIFFRLLCAFST